MDNETTIQVVKKLAQIVELGQILSEFESIEKIGPMGIRLMGAAIRDDANSIGLKLDAWIKAEREHESKPECETCQDTGEVEEMHTEFTTDPAYCNCKAGKAARKEREEYEQDREHEND